MSVDYDLYDRNNKKIKCIDGYLISNFDFFIDKYNSKPLPMYFGDIETKKIYEYSEHELESIRDSYEYWLYEGKELLYDTKNLIKRNINNIGSRYKPIANTIDDLINILPEILDSYRNKYYYILSI